MAPISPNDVKWEESEGKVTITVALKYISKESIDVYISDEYLRVNAGAGAVVWHCDLLRKVKDGTCYLQQFDQFVEVRIGLVKEEPGLWRSLQVEGLTPTVRKERRLESIRRHEAAYEKRLAERQAVKEKEEKRYFNQHWDLEKQQRNDIVEKIKQEAAENASLLQDWEAEQDAAELTQSAPQRVDCVDTRPAIRSQETAVIQTTFTPQIGKAPARGSHDEEYYYQSSYKPRNAKDTPVHFKTVADEYFRNGQFKAAASNYGEALKRDAAFLLAVMNRAACYIRLFKYDKAIEDCNLAYGMVQNTPASNTTPERYRYLMMKLLVRRGAAHAWSGNLQAAVDDYRVAIGYVSPEVENVKKDLASLEDLLRAEGGDEGPVEVNPLVEKKRAADRFVMDNSFDKAVELYNEILESNPLNMKAKLNRVLCYMHLGKFGLAVSECNACITQCGEIVTALSSTAYSDEWEDNSDNEESTSNSRADRQKNETAEEKRKRLNSKLVKEKTAQIMLLLKAYVRKGTALCGLGEFTSAAAAFEKALSITPYDDDIRKDLQTITEKARIQFLTSTAKSK